MTVLHTLHYFFCTRCTRASTCLPQYDWQVYPPAKPPPPALLPPFHTAGKAVTCTASVGSVQPPAGAASLFWAAQDHQAPASVNRWTSSRGRPDLHRGLFSFTLSSVTQISSFVLFRTRRFPSRTCFALLSTSRDNPPS